MTPAQITSLTTAFAPGQFFSIWVDFAPFMIAIIGVLVGIGLVSWGVRKIRSKLSRGAA